MAKLEIRDLFFDPAKPNDPPKWDTVILDLEVDAGDYRVIRSKVGRKLIYTIKYESVEDPAFKENPSDPAPPAGQTPKRWNKMYRCWFDLNFRRSTENPTAKPISNEENVTYPELLPEAISKSPPPEGTTWPKDPYYRLYKNYKYTDPTPAPTTKKCDLDYMGDMHVFVQRLFSLLTIMDIEQKIRQPGETPPPPPEAGQTESAEETAKRLKNFIKLNAIKDQLRAEYKILTVAEETTGTPPVTSCATKKTEIKKIALRSLGCTEENKDDYEIIDLPIVRF